MKRLIALLLLAGGMAWGSTTTLTGNINDAQGNGLNGTLVMQLPTMAQDITTNTQITVSPVTFRVVNGAITGGAPLYDVANLRPTGLYYITNVYDSAGRNVFNGNFYVTGTTFNLGAATPTNITTSNVSFANPVFTGLTVNGAATITGALTAGSVNATCQVTATQSLATCITNVGTSGTIEVTPLAGTVTVSANATIPAGVTLKIDQGAILSVATAVTVQVNGPFIAGPYKVFTLTGTGVVNFATGMLAELWPQWWGGAGDGVTDNVAAFNAAVTAACGAGSPNLRYTTGAFRFVSKPNNVGCGIVFKGEGNGANTAFGTALIADYVESTSTNGFMTFDGSFGIAAGTGGGFENLQIYKPGTQTGGAAVALISTDDNHRPGWFHLTHVQIWAALTATWNYNLYVDGHNNSTVNSQGIRDLFFHDSRFEGISGVDTSVWLNNAAHALFDGCLIDGSSGTPGMTITGTGAAGANTLNSVDISIGDMSIFGDLVIDKASAVLFRGSVQGTGTLSITANAAASSFQGSVTSGTVTNSSTTSEIILLRTDFTAVEVLGAAVGAVASGQALPTGTSGSLFSRTGATAGSVVFGDASCFVGMASAGVFNLNCGNSANFNLAGTGTTLQFNGTSSGSTKLQGASAAGGTLTLPNATGSLATAYTCGTIAANGACSNTALGGTAHVISGIATLSGSTSTITGLSPAFTSASTYYCVANDITTRANPVQAIPASGTTVTFTNTTGATDNIAFICIGN